MYILIQAITYMYYHVDESCLTSLATETLCTHQILYIIQRTSRSSVWLDLRIVPSVHVDIRFAVNLANIGICFVKKLLNPCI